MLATAYESCQSQMHQSRPHKEELGSCPRPLKSHSVVYIDVVNHGLLQSPNAKAMICHYEGHPTLDQAGKLVHSQIDANPFLLLGNCHKVPQQGVYMRPLVGSIGLNYMGLELH